jgi:hypothetical protein
MTSWNWDQMYHVLSKGSLADAYSIESSCYLPMQFEETFKWLYGLSSAQAMLEVHPIRSARGVQSSDGIFS